MATQQYPYSSLFDYDELAREEALRKKQLIDSQQKIQRTNAIGDALRLLVDAIGGSKGATITQRAVNPGILRASEKINAIRSESDARTDRLRLQDLAMKQKDLEHNLAQEDVEKAFGRQKEVLDIQSQYRSKEAADEAARRLQEGEVDTENKIKIEKVRGAEEANVQRIRNQGTQAVAQTRATTTTRSRTQKGADSDYEFIPPGTNQPIFITSAELTKMFNVLAGESKDRSGDYSLDAVLKAIRNNEKPEQRSLDEVLYRYWNKIKQVLPEFQTGAEATQSLNTPLLPGYQPVTPYQQGKGPLRNYGSPTITAPQQTNPSELSKGIFGDAKSIYDNGTTADQVATDLKKLINLKYPNANPATKAAIYNDLISKF